MAGQVTIIDHPLIQHKLTLMRMRQTSTASFRTLLTEVSLLLGYEVTRDLPLTFTRIETPLAAMRAPLLDGKKIVLVGVLRAGLGLLDGMLKILPSARVGHIGLYREADTLNAKEYYFKLPAKLAQRDVIVVDPMLATGNTAVAALERIKQAKPRSVKLVSLLSAPEGIANFHGQHPEVPIVTAAVDERLDEHGYIVPGLGDAGDRMFGTR
jgi:uracil phosphoribosyltransferase